MTRESLQVKERITSILDRHQVKRAALFGSVARGEATPASDVDILIEFSGTPSLLDLVRLEAELTAALGRPVDAVTPGSLSPYIRPRVLRNLQVIYEGS